MVLIKTNKVFSENNTVKSIIYSLILGLIAFNSISQIPRNAPGVKKFTGVYQIPRDASTDKTIFFSAGIILNPSDTLTIMPAIALVGEINNSQTFNLPDSIKAARLGIGKYITRNSKTEYRYVQRCNTTVGKFFKRRKISHCMQSVSETDLQILNNEIKKIKDVFHDSLLRSYNMSDVMYNLLSKYSSSHLFFFTDKVDYYVDNYSWQHIWGDNEYFATRIFVFDSQERKLIFYDSYVTFRDNEQRSRVSVVNDWKDTDLRSLLKEMMQKLYQ